MFLLMCCPAHPFQTSRIRSGFPIGTHTLCTVPSQANRALFGAIFNLHVQSACLLLPSKLPCSIKFNVSILYTSFWFLGSTCKHFLAEGLWKLLLVLSLRAPKVICIWVANVISGDGLQAPQPDTSEQPKKSKKEKGSKKKGKKGIDFASLPEGDDDEPPAVSEEASQPPPPENAEKGKKSSRAAVSFADGTSDGEAAQPVADSDDEATTVPAVKPKRAKKGSKKAAVSFADLSDDGEAGDQSSHPPATTNGSLAESDEEAPLQISGKKKKSKKSSFVMPAEFEDDSAPTGAVFLPS